MAAAVLTAALALGPAAAAAPLAKAVPVGTFSSPVYVTTAPGQSQLLFVVEQGGTIRVLRNETVLATPFLDIGNRISCCDERGMLSMAFAPDYAASGLFYVAYTNVNGDIEVDEFKRIGSSAAATRADPRSRRHLLSVLHRGASNHNGGQLQFGPDGYLYISTGDGGELTPRGEPARRLNSLLGKIMRIDPKPANGKPYQIPPDNPFVGDTAKRPEIYAYGFRNPWRFSFDGQRLIVADVGQSRQEEIDYLPVRAAKGVNFGWPQFEGRLVYDNTRPGPTPAKFPLAVYNHTNGRCAIIGGYVSHDPRIPKLAGQYLFGDLCDGVIHALSADVAAQKPTANRLIGVTAPGLTTFGVGPGKRIYFATTGGDLFRLDPP
jgi:glucose/arabinose dehydrogenase